jgi:hypothetical protein
VLSASELGGSEAGEPPHPAADVTRQRISETTNEPVGRTRAHGHCGAAPRRSGSCASGRDGHQILMAIVAIVEGQGVQDALPAVEQSGQVLTLLLPARGDEVEDLQGLRRGSVSRRYRNPCRTCTGSARECHTATGAATSSIYRASTTKFAHISRASGRPDPDDPDPERVETPAEQGFLQWAILDSNQRPLPCEVKIALGHHFPRRVIKGRQGLRNRCSAADRRRPTATPSRRIPADTRAILAPSPRAITPRHSTAERDKKRHLVLVLRRSTRRAVGSGTDGLHGGLDRHLAGLRPTPAVSGRYVDPGVRSPGASDRDSHPSAA